MALIDKLSAIGDAIREKTGTVEKLTLDEMPSMISQISGGGDSVENFINFYDWDGALLHQYTLPEFAKLEGLPNGPDNLLGHEFVEWNYDFPTIVSMNSHVNVSAIYNQITVEKTEEETEEPVFVDQTKLRIHLTRPTSVTLYIRQSVSNGVSIYWGDGESSGAGTNYGSSNISVSHKYALPGDYEIAFVLSDTCTLTLGWNSKNYCVIGSASSLNGALTILTGAEIDTRTTILSSGAFRYCYNLESVVFGDGPDRNIPTYAFQCCYGLETIRLHTSVTGINDYAFESCSCLTKIDVPASCKSIGAASFRYCRSLYEARIGTSAIGSEAFRYCSALRRISFAEIVTTISSYAFGDCENLESIIIPNSVKSIGNYAFQNCYSLSEVALPAGLATIGTAVFSGCSMLQNIALPNTLTSILDSAFSGCTALRFIGFPKNTISISNSAFSNCQSLRNAVFSQNMQTIQSAAFYGCTALEYIILPSSMGSVANRAFNGCSCVKNVVIPSAIAEINGMLTELYPFSKYLKKIYDTMLTGGLPIKDYAFYKCLYVERAAVNGAAESIGQYAFANNPVLRAAMIPYGVKTIGAYAFNYDYQLWDLSLPESLTGLGDYAFRGCKSLERVVFPENLNRSGIAVLNESGVKKVTIKSSNFTLSDNALAVCRRLKEIVAPRAATLVLGQGAFSSSMIEEVKDLPINTSIVGQQLFENCHALNYADLSTATITATAYLFRYCYALRNVVLPASLTNIGQEMFRDCRSLKEITLPDRVTSLYTGAFNGCVNLRRIDLGENLYTINSDAFVSCHSLREIKIPPSVVNLYNCFNNCYGLEKIWMYPINVPSSNTTSLGGSLASNYVIYVPKGHMDEYAAKYTSHAGHFEEFEFIIPQRSKPTKYILLSDTTCVIRANFIHSYFDEDQTFTISAVYDGTNLQNIENIQFDYVNSTISFDFTRSEDFNYSAVDSLSIHIDVDGKDISCDMNVTVKYLDTDLYLEYEVVHVSGYQFTEKADGYWKSGNENVHNSYSLCKIVFRTSAQTLYLDCYNSGELNYDYGIVSNIDCTLQSGSNSDSGDNVKRSFHGFAGNETLEFSVNDADEHFIYCKYRKDGSVNSGSDCFKFKVRSLYDA